jgi:hypothetical protein
MPFVDTSTVTNLLEITRLKSTNQLSRYSVGPRIGNWSNWNLSVEDFLFTVDSGADITSVFVPTVDSLKMQYFLGALGRCGRAVLLIGEPGTSKTSQLCNYLNNTKSDARVSKVVNFSVSTTPLMFQASLLNCQVRMQIECS